MRVLRCRSTTHGTLGRIPDITIGPYSFKRVVAELSDATEGYFAKSPYVGNMGGEIWRRFSVTLDYAHGRMYLTPDDAFDELFVGPRSGLTPALVGAVVKVVDVAEGGPAAESGVQVGDTILAVNGAHLPVPALDSTSSIDGVVQALQAEPGTRVSLSVLNTSGVQREVTWVLRDLL